jgi:hypothetical protein
MTRSSSPTLNWKHRNWKLERTIFSRSLKQLALMIQHKTLGANFARMTFPFNFLRYNKKKIGRPKKEEPLSYTDWKWINQSNWLIKTLGDSSQAYGNQKIYKTFSFLVFTQIFTLETLQVVCKWKPSASSLWQKKVFN